MTKRSLFACLLATSGIALSLLNALTGCNLAGGAYPEKGGPKFLMEQGFSALLAERVVQGDPLEPAELESLGKLRNQNVHFLLARNPHLPPSAIDRFIRDRDDFVRSGAARNPSLTEQHIETLMNDSSHTVLIGLAGNPILTDERQMWLHRNDRITLVYFAMNPNCAKPLRDAILRSDDADAKYWLKVTADWTEQGIFAKGADGRWKRDRVSHSARVLTSAR